VSRTAAARASVGYGLAFLGAVLFSSKAVVVKLAYHKGLDVETLMALRMGLALPVYAAVGWWSAARRGTPGPLDRWALLRAGAVGILGYWLASYTDFLGLALISATFERLILFTYPLFVVLLGWAFFGGRIGWRAIAAFAISYSGLALVFLAHRADTVGNVPLGAFWVTVSAIAFALYQLLAKDSIGRLGAAVFTSVAMAAAGLVALATFVATRPLGALAGAWPAAGEIAFLVFGATILPSFILSAALARISAAANGVIGMVSPLATIVFAAIFLGETLGPAEWSGTGLVLLGVALFVLAERRG
jgi:drug/metabolite transporter (DMT)-like permease